MIQAKLRNLVSLAFLGFGRTLLWLVLRTCLIFVISTTSFILFGYLRRLYKFSFPSDACYVLRHGIPCWKQDERTFHAAI